MAYVPPDGFHCHKCDNGHVWEHSNTMSESHSAHDCPICGRHQTFHHLGGEAPVRRDETVIFGPYLRDMIPPAELMLYLLLDRLMSRR